MVAGKNYNIMTATVFPPVATGAAVAIGGVVAAGMKRYVTYVRVTQRAPTKNLGTKVWFCSTLTIVKASTTAHASTAMKLVLRVPSAIGAKKFEEAPKHPDTENPLFSVAESRYLTCRLSAGTSGSASCSVFVQYYDQ